MLSETQTKIESWGNMGISGFKAFLVVWVGQLFSVVGSGLTQFALGVWVLKETGSVTMFSLMLLFATFPAIIFSPFAGVIVDRYNRRTVMIISDTIAAIGTLVMFLLYTLNAIEIWHLFIILSFSSAANSMQFPAYQAAISTLVPKEHLGRASGMVQVAESISIIVAPVMAGFLLTVVGLQGIVIIDFATFLVAMVALLFVKIPNVKTKEENEKKRESAWKEAAFGWRYILDRPGLKWMLVFFAVSNFLLGFFNILLQPYILSFSNEKVLGLVLSCLGVGMLIGGLVMGVWGGPKQRVKGLLGFGLLSGLALTVAGFQSSAILVAISIALQAFFMPLTNGCSQAIWQSKVPLEVQGRVFALRRMIALSLSPIAYVLAGPLIDYVFEPAMMSGGTLANSFGLIFGVGEGRGMGLFITLIGIGWALVSILVYLNPRVRNLEKELPDNDEVVMVQDTESLVQGN